MNILYLIFSIILFFMCNISFVIQLTLNYYIPAALDVLGGVVSGYCIHLTYLSYRDRLLKVYKLETLKKLCDVKYTFLFIVGCVIGYHITYLAIHRDAFDKETRFIALQLSSTVASVILLIRVLLVIKKKLFMETLTEDYT